MNKELVLTILLVVLVLVSVFQALQLMQVNNAVDTEAVATKSTSSGGSIVAPSGGGVQAPSNIQNLPGMVGGC